MGPPECHADPTASLLAILPVALNAFGQFSLTAFISNVLIFPTIPPALFFGCLIALFVCLPFAALLRARTAEAVLWYELAVIRICSVVTLPISSMFGSFWPFAAYYAVLISFITVTRLIRNKNQKIVIAIIIAIVVLSDVSLWWNLFSAKHVTVAHDYFLDVGQGDSELVVFPGNVKIMTDAGPTDAVVGELADVLPQGDAYIDVAVISHPQADHFNGYNVVLDHYRVGVFIYNGRDDDPTDVTWNDLEQKIAGKGIPLITLGRGDKIRYNHDYEVDILAPDLAFDESAELNDTDCGAREDARISYAPYRRHGF